MSEGDFDPYYQWLGIPPRDQPAHHYRLLGIDSLEANPDVISHAADRQMAHVRSFQAGPHAAQSQQILNEIAIARFCLLDAVKKAAYDVQLGRQLAAPAGAAPVSAADPDANQPAANVFGDYLLLKLLSAGRAGKVFKARHRTMGRVVALKILNAEGHSSQELVQRFRRKIKVLAGLSHQNLLSAYDAGERHGRLFLVTEYVDGHDLSSLLKKHHPVPISHVINIISQAAAGLQYAHAHKVFHRNVKPGNLMVDQEGVVKVIGLGLARMDSGDDGELPGPELTQPGQVLGTVDYMAPEQTLDSTAVDHRADIYSLGCTLFVALTRRVMYPVKSPMKKLLAHRSEPPPSLRDVRSDVSPELEAAYFKMVAKQPGQRYASMQEAIDALRDCG